MWPAATASAPGDDPDAEAARRLLAAFLASLSRRLRPALLDALGRAARAWDQVDVGNVVDADLRGQAEKVASAWRAVGGPRATLALLTLDAALDLVRLVERRLATLVRLRLRSLTPELTVRGRPFLDVPSALAEAARRWS